jgi:hypothetical protein
MKSLKKLDKEIDKLTLAKSEFAECKIWLFLQSCKLSIYGQKLSFTKQLTDFSQPLLWQGCIVPKVITTF